MELVPYQNGDVGELLIRVFKSERFAYLGDGIKFVIDVNVAFVFTGGVEDLDMRQ